ncbi:MAG: hypothetical protein LBU81_02600 [Methanosarcinales archaeon]|jgi:nickel transport protein|nr:hypothetical protein [Methanosarcinales archaeon]
MIQKKVKYLAALLILILAAVPAAAHGVYMSWEQQGGSIEIRAYYQRNEPMTNGSVVVETLDASGTAAPYLTGQADTNGNYKFNIKSGVSSYRVKVIEGEHAVSKKIDIAAAPGSGTEESGNEKSSLFGTQGPSLFTIGAGLGWIVGIAGIVLYLQARKINKAE